ncbi:hypothetical protein AX16_008457 [Volvariella volvacea WC 439]|nr:hypothetical protein AX16_008457 [Volvariella volvacea WC 439]
MATLKSRDLHENSDELIIDITVMVVIATLSVLCIALAYYVRRLRDALASYQTDRESSIISAPFLQAGDKEGTNWQTYQLQLGQTGEKLPCDIHVAGNMQPFRPQDNH